MSKSFHSPCFAWGVVAAVLLACLIGAAQQEDHGIAKYDAAPAMGGLGLQIVDHDTNSLYNYRRDKDGDGVTYKLIEKIDLTLTGEAEIPADVSK